MDGEKLITGSVLLSPLQVLNILSESKNGERMAVQKGPAVVVNDTENPMFASEDDKTLFLYQTEQF